MSFNYSFNKLFSPTLLALKELGGSGRNEEIEEKVIKILKLKDEEVNDIHRGNVTKLNYRLRWARNYLKNAGYLENSSRGVWALIGPALHDINISEESIIKAAKLATASIQNDNQSQINETVEPIPTTQEEIQESWREILLTTIKGIEPDQFERLTQRLLRELGLSDVEVTGRSGDRGIDGKGLLKLGVISFRIVFQCKRYQDTVGSSEVRDFRGAYQGRADRALLITTGRFTRDAKQEAQRDGALVIDLIDGEELVDKIKSMGLGIKVELIEKIIIDQFWFKDL